MLKKHWLEAVKIVLGLLSIALLSDKLTSMYLLTQAKESVVFIHIGHGGGTGFVVKGESAEPVLVTNSHVCNGQEWVDVNRLWEERQHKLKVLQDDSEHDLCIVEAPANVPALSLAPKARKGEYAMVFGHPGLKDLVASPGRVSSRMDIEISIPLKDGQCNGKIKEVEQVLGPLLLKQEVCIKTQDALSITNKVEPGNSGSPVLNKWGEVIGVVFAGDGRMNFAVPLEYLRALLQKY